VCKPRFGAGSQATFLAPTVDHLENVLALARQEIPDAEFILQRFTPGVPASVSFLAGSDRILPLLPSAQHFSTDGRFRYHGGEVPLPAELAQRALDLASRAVTAFPQLQGYIGVDLVLGEPADGSEDVVIEINPRLTTSYIGLRRLARANLAQALLDLVTGKGPPALEWHTGIVRFQADGTIWN
jgi:predicted ATP-grasp superfamily ATP-dependent carboligase